MSKFKIGDVVVLVDGDDIYPNYSDWANSNDIYGFVKGFFAKCGDTGKVVKIAPHGSDKKTLYAVQLGTKLTFIAGEGGLELVGSAPTKDNVKETNPKDAIGSKKHPLNIVPDTLQIYAAMAFAEGGAKYSPFNWRVAGIRASVYKAAHDRHMAKWWNGEECDPETNVPHLASAIACLAIILDADLCGKMNDDRPPYAPMRELIEECEKVVAFVNELHKDKRGTLKEYKLSDYPNVELNEPI